MTIARGDALPAASFKIIGESGPADISSEELFGQGRVALFAVPGAFTPTCHNAHMPGFVRNADALRAKGVDRIVCVSVNDPFVLKAWGEATGAAAAGITLVADPDASFARALGLEFDASAVGLGVRSKRYAMLVENGRVVAVNVEDAPSQAVASTADELLKLL